MKILIIEDEALLAESLKTLLELRGFEVEVVSDGESGAEYAETGIYDLLLLDVMMPRLDGYSLARRVRARRVTTPILMLTARADVQDRIEGLNAGADYYLTKPFDNRELLACINALLRRQGAQFDVLAYGNTSLDLTGCTLSTAGGSVRLSSKEFDVMRLLMQAEGRSVRKETILTRSGASTPTPGTTTWRSTSAFCARSCSAIGSNLTIEAIRLLGYHLEVHGA